MNDSRRILLLSTSTVHGSGYLDYAEDELADFLAGTSRLLFVPFALHDRDSYARRVSERFARIGVSVTSLHSATDSMAAVNEADAMFIGGGNTFRLLAAIQQQELIAAIRERVGGGMPYIGSSAGSNVAAPTIRTTNDMPIVEPRSFDALGLVAFQLNPHFIDADPASTHMGETREERIAQFHEENETPVLGLREGAFVRVENGVARLGGASGARLFRRGVEAVELTSGAELPGFLPNE